MKRASMGSREDNYEHVLMCLICRSLFDDYDHQPKFLPCHHTFCKDCLREYVRQFGDEIECPSCRKIANIPTAGVTALQTNFYVKYIQSLVSGGGCSAASDQKCGVHANEKLHYFCKVCEASICKQCCTPESCGQHEKVSLTFATEESHQNLDSAFSKANSTIENKKVQLEKTLKALADEKDQALLKIDSTFDQHTHTIQRRATLLKNKVIAIYNEHKDKLENDLEEISTALTCIVSIKDYAEERISVGEFRNLPKGLEELEEVNQNISERIHASQNHIVFEQNHGSDKYKDAVKDLGRVKCSRPIAPRAEPEGNAGEDNVVSLTSPVTPEVTPSVEAKSFEPEPESPKLSIEAAVSSCTAQNGVPTADILPLDLTVNTVTVAEQRDVIPKKCKEVEKDIPVPSEKDIKGQKESSCAQTNITFTPNKKPQNHYIPKVSDAKRDVKPKVAQSYKMDAVHSAKDKNQNQVCDLKAPSTKSPTMAKLQLKLGKNAKTEVKSDHQNGNFVPGLSKIPQKFGNVVSPTDKGKSGQTKSKLPQKSDLTKGKGHHGFGLGGHGSNKRLPQPNANVSKAIGAHGGVSKQSVMSQAVGIDNSLQGRQAAPLAAAPPMSAMPDILPESVLKVMQSGTDDEKLKAEKEYYHLLYTSYDEEELLRELKSGCAPDFPPLPEIPWTRAGRTSLEDSDNSWLTTSSASDGASESEETNTDENDILSGPQQTTV